MNQDEHHLQLLSIFHYVVAGLTALMAAGFLLFFPLGAFLMRLPGNAQQPAPPSEVGWVVIAIGAVAVVVTLAYAVAVFVAGRCLMRRRCYVFCLVVAAFNCLNAPLGTVLGIFTIVVLSRTSVRALFPEPPSTPSPPA